MPLAPSGPVAMVDRARFLSRAGLTEARDGWLATPPPPLVTTLGTPHDITLQELRVEAFFPAG